MPSFAPGASKTAITAVILNPSGLSSETELFLGPDESTKVATSGRVPFISTGSSQNMSLPVIMPSQIGTYRVFLDVYAGGQLIAGYIASEDVQIQSPIMPWSFSSFSAQVVPWVSPMGYTFYFVLYSITVKNNGNQPATKTVSLYYKTYDWFLFESIQLTLTAGQSYVFSSPAPPDALTIFPGQPYDIQFRTSDGEVSNIIRVSV